MSNLKEVYLLKEKFKQNVIVLPYPLNTRLYMIPTFENNLKEIVSYELLSYSISDIGIRAELFIVKKQKNCEEIYSASLDMFGQSIFKSLLEAEITYNINILEKNLKEK